jgi:hypothetical protein
MIATMLNNSTSAPIAPAIAPPMTIGSIDDPSVICTKLSVVVVAFVVDESDVVETNIDIDIDINEVNAFVESTDIEEVGGVDDPVSSAFGVDGVVLDVDGVVLAFVVVVVGVGAGVGGGVQVRVLQTQLLLVGTMEQLKQLSSRSLQLQNRCKFE